MSTIDEIVDEILAEELTAQQCKKATALFTDVPHISTLLRFIEDWLCDDRADAKASLIVHNCVVEMAKHEAETD